MKGIGKYVRTFEDPLKLKIGHRREGEGKVKNGERRIQRFRQPVIGFWDESGQFALETTLKEK